MRRAVLQDGDPVTVGKQNPWRLGLGGDLGRFRRRVGLGHVRAFARFGPARVVPFSFGISAQVIRQVHTRLPRSSETTIS